MSETLDTIDSKYYSDLGGISMFVIHIKNQPQEMPRLVAMPTFILKII